MTSPAFTTKQGRAAVLVSRFDPVFVNIVTEQRGELGRDANRALTSLPVLGRGIRLWPMSHLNVLIVLVEIAVVNVKRVR